MSGNAHLRETRSACRNSRVESMTSYEWCDEKPPSVPPRSRVFSVEPVGSGTPYVESLTGYIARLAKEESVSTGVLFGWELAPRVGKKYLRSIGEKADLRGGILSNSFRLLSTAVNGMGVIASDWRQAVEDSTLRRDLTPLTMLTWRHALSDRGLLRRSRAWCPACYESWRQGGREVYEPLLWALEAVTLCSRHRRRLRAECQHCRRLLPLLAPRSRPGFCSKCERWLGTFSACGDKGEPVTEEDAVWQAWVTHSLGELLSAVPKLQGPPPRDAVARSTVACIELVAAGNEGAFSGAVGTCKTVIKGWRTGARVPQLPTLLRVCHAVGLSPLNFLSGEVTALCRQDGVAGSRGAVILPTAIKRTLRPLALVEARQALEAALKELPSPPLSEAARRIGRSPATLRYRYPELCAEIASRHSRQIKKRWEEAGRAMEAISLSEQTPPSMAEIARSLDCHKSTLSKMFPELCHRIAARRAEYVKAEASARNRRRDEEIRQTASALHAAGQDPTPQRVGAAMPHPIKIGSSKKGLAMLRAARRELGLS